MNEKEVNWYVFVDEGKHPSSTLGVSPKLEKYTTATSYVMVSAGQGKKIFLDPKVTYSYKLDPRYPGDLLSMYESRNLFLMTDKLLKTLQSVGVNNLEIFDASIEDTIGKKIHKDYKLVNIIGTVDVLDTRQSVTIDESIGQGIDKMFGQLGYDRLRINEQAADNSNLLLFRLKGSRHIVIAHKSVKDAVEKIGFNGVMFLKPQNWAGA
jgi:hypothetical protein